MKPTLNVHALPEYVNSKELAGGATAVIDILRAATTITYALDAGAMEVIPCVDISDAVSLAQQFDEDQIVLGGERGGLAIEGFQLGNSPEEYTAERVGGKTVIFTTTNGTRAMNHARLADAIFVTAFVNASATVAKLLERKKIDIVCAGTDGRISDDDILVAGLLVDRIQRQSGDGYLLNAQALTSREFWLNSFALPQAIGAEPLAPERLAERLRNTPGGENLIRVGLDEDILAASYIDRFDIVANLDVQTLRIRHLVD